MPIYNPIQNSDLIAFSDTAGNIVATNVGGALTESAVKISDNALYSEQIDYVKFVKENKTVYPYKAFQKFSATSFEVFCHNGINHLTYRFVKDALDDFIKIDQCFIGTIDYVLKTRYDTDSRTGVWDTATYNNYTTEIGATFTCKGYGEQLVLYINTETRGGLWQVVIDGDTDNPVNVSCYNATVANRFVVVAEGLDKNIEHTVVGTFMGDDPSNAPSSNPSRGYLYNRTDDTIKGSLNGYYKTNTVVDIIMAADSNKEMAFAININASGNWIPEHNGQGSVTKIDEPKYLIDGSEFDFVNAVIGAVGIVPIENDFKLLQHFYGTHATAGNVIEVNLAHHLNGESLNYLGNFISLRDFIMVSGYPLMAPMGIAVNEVVTGITNNQVNAGDESYIYFASEKDKVFSSALVNAANTDIVGACRVNIPIKSMRLNKSKTSVGIPKSLFLWQRATEPKLYWQSFTSVSVTEGEFYAWGGEFIIASIDNIYGLVKS